MAEQQVVHQNETGAHYNKHAIAAMVAVVLAGWGLYAWQAFADPSVGSWLISALAGAFVVMVAAAVVFVPLALVIFMAFGGKK